VTYIDFGHMASAVATGDIAWCRRWLVERGGVLPKDLARMSDVEAKAMVAGVLIGVSLAAKHGAVEVDPHPAAGAGIGRAR